MLLKHHFSYIVPFGFRLYLGVVAVHVDDPPADLGSNSRVIRYQCRSSVGHRGSQSYPVPSSRDGHGFAPRML